jgi:hypothetical protein
MTTISHVRECDPRSMIELAGQLTDRTTTFSAHVEQMRREVDAAANDWRGDAATAARALAHELAGNHVGAAVVAVADHYDAYGAELDGYRSALLAILDTELPIAGMAADDTGSVTAPRIPGADSFVVNYILQQQIDGQAAGFQHRIKHLLAHFGTTEKAAAKAVTTALASLAGYASSPAAPTVGSRIRHFLDGRAPLPTDPRQLHNLWRTLTPAERDALWRSNRYLGNLDGIPAADRDHYNRMTLADELARAASGAPTGRDVFDDLRTVAAQVERPGRYLLELDVRTGARTHAVISAGNPDTADHVATYVPGTGSRPSAIGGDMDRVEAMRGQAKSAGAAAPAVIAWLGYDAPQSLPEATSRTYADRASTALDRFQDGLRASHAGPPSYNTVIGHSYGATVVGDAAHGHNLNADAVVFVASPGTTVDHAGELTLTGIPPTQVPRHVYATKAEHDPVSLYADSGLGGFFPGSGIDDLGPDPTQRDYGARVFASDPGTAGPWYLDWYNGEVHSRYWDPGNSSLRGMGEIIAGGAARAD